MGRCLYALSTLILFNFLETKYLSNCCYICVEFQNYRIMSLLSSDFDIKDEDVFRNYLHSLIADEVKVGLNRNNAVLLFDPHDEFDLHYLQGVLEGPTAYYDMSQCKSGDYEVFVKQYVLPLVNGQIDYLLVDNVDKIPDIEEKDVFEILLKLIAKGEEYDPFQNILYVDKGSEHICRTGTIDFDKYKNRLIMRCEEKPSFLEPFTCHIVDCRNFVLLIHFYLEKSDKAFPLMLIFGKESGNSRLDECKRWVHEVCNSVDSKGHPFKQGNEYFLDKDGNQQKLSDHTELLNRVILPESVTPETEFLLLHRYVDQFNPEALKYALDVVREHQLPVVFLTNSYEYNPNIDLQGFKVYHLK